MISIEPEDVRPSKQRDQRLGIHIPSKPHEALDVFHRLCEKVISYPLEIMELTYAHQTFEDACKAYYESKLFFMLVEPMLDANVKLVQANRHTVPSLMSSPK